MTRTKQEEAEQARACLTLANGVVEDLLQGTSNPNKVEKLKKLRFYLSRINPEALVQEDDL